MKFTFLVVGKSKFSFAEDGLQHYLKNIRHFGEAEILELKDQSSDREKEAETIRQAIKKRSEGRTQVILLDERGKNFSSVDLAARIGQWRDQGVHKFIFVVGGAYGFTDAMRTEFPEWLALSKLTFPHDLVRVFLAEQIYRSLHILSGGKYHHEG